MNEGDPRALEGLYFLFVVIDEEDKTFSTVQGKISTYIGNGYYLVEVRPLVDPDETVCLKALPLEKISFWDLYPDKYSWGQALISMMETIEQHEQQVQEAWEGISLEGDDEDE